MCRKWQTSQLTNIRSDKARCWIWLSILPRIYPGFRLNKANSNISICGHRKKCVFSVIYSFKLLLLSNNTNEHLNTWEYIKIIAAISSKYDIPVQMVKLFAQRWKSTVYSHVWVLCYPSNRLAMQTSSWIKASSPCPLNNILILPYHTKIIRKL